MMETLDLVVKFMSAISSPILLLVAIGTLRGRGDDKAGMLVGMQKDIEFIKENTSCIPAQTKALIALEASVKAAHRRLDEHIATFHKEGPP